MHRVARAEDFRKHKEGILDWIFAIPDSAGEVFFHDDLARKPLEGLLVERSKAQLRYTLEGQSSNAWWLQQRIEQCTEEIRKCQKV